jgi:hypothetical protein
LSNKGEGAKMKRKFSILMLCSLLLITTVGTVMAGNDVYSVIEYWAQAQATYDGVWTSDTEWTDGPATPISDDAIFTYTMSYTDTYDMYSQFLIEFFGDTTDDAEDYMQICIDPSNGGGSTPQTGYGRIDINGHTEIVCYAGDGTGWTEIAVDDDIEWANSISESPLNSTPHWILELQFDKQVNAMLLTEPPNGIRFAVYDASTDTLAAWPPDSDVNNPNTWGVVPTYSQEPIPEGLNFAVMAFLSSVSLVVGSHYLHKRSKKRKTV